MSIDWTRFPGQVKYWTLHCSINALPSFLIAAIFLKLGKHPLDVVAMILAVATFAGLYSLATSLRGWGGDPESLPSRALRMGVRIRLMASVWSLLLLLGGQSAALMLSPDLWCGMIALGLVNWAGGFLGANGQLIQLEGGSESHLAVYATTMIEGFLLSGMLLMFSFFALLAMQIRQRRKAATWETR